MPKMNSFRTAIFCFLFAFAYFVQGQCPPMYKPTFGRLGKCDNSVGGTCQIICQRGYELVGTQVRRCTEDGMWSGDTPSCVDRQVICRSRPNLPPNSQLSPNCPNYLGSQCDLRCNNGYSLVGNGILTCSVNGGDAVWILTPGQCRRASCRKLRYPNNGYFINKCRRNVGAECVVGCRPPYTLRGSNVQRCLRNGRWSGKRPICVLDEGCPSINNVNNGLISGSCQPGVVGRSCRFSCNPGFQLIGSNSITCLRSEGWSGTPPVCQSLQCPPITPSEEGITSGSCNPGRSGQACYFSCRNGFRIIGPTSIVCQENGMWSADPPYCQSNGCPALNLPTNGILSGTCTSGQIGQWCNIACNEGYTLIGNGNLLCQVDGTWSDPQPICQKIPSCPNLQPPFNGRLGNCNNIVGGVCTVLCNNGYIISGSKSVICLANGQWSTTPAVCKRRYVTTYKVVPLWMFWLGK